MKVVIRNHNANTGITLSKHKKHVLCIFMDSDGIKLTKVGYGEFDATWSAMDYDYKQAARRLYNVGITYFGITKEAERLLKEIIE